MDNFLRRDMEDALTAMEVLAKAFEKPPFDVYVLGGAGCVLAEYFDRATRDFDIIDLEYSASLGLVMKPLEPFDMIDPQLAAIPPGYKARAVRLPTYKYLSVYVLAREDIIISKAARLNERDMADIRKLLPFADLPLMVTLTKKLIAGSLPEAAKTVLLDNLIICMEEAGVSDYVQQLAELRKRFRQ